MTGRRQLLLAGGSALLLAALAFALLPRSHGAEPAAEPEPTAVVTLAPIRRAQIEDVVSVYGSVQSDPATNFTVAAPKAAIVLRVLVRAGEPVNAGQPMVEIANAPGADMSYRQAADAVTFATADLARVQRLYDERLAASDQVTAANKALADAKAGLAAQTAQGAGRRQQTIAAPRAGVVTTVSAVAGDHVAQDAPLLVMARADGAAVRLGLEPSGRFTAGQAVILKPVFGGPPINSRIALVGRSADPATKTLDAIVPLNGAALPIGAAVQGEVVTGGHPGLLAPRGAVVFDETGPHLFVVSGGKARRVFVNVGRDQGPDIEIAGQAPAGAQVAVEGAYELQDGMAVRIRRQ